MTYDPECAYLYVHGTPNDHVAYTVDVAPDVNVDFLADGRVFRIERIGGDFSDSTALLAVLRAIPAAFARTADMLPASTDEVSPRAGKNDLVLATEDIDQHNSEEQP